MGWAESFPSLRVGYFIAMGHYRHRFLQASATALVIADLVEGKAPSIDISAFSSDLLSNGRANDQQPTAHVSRYSPKA